MRTYLRSKVTLLFMMLGLLLAVPAVAFAADGLVADADTISSGDNASRTFAGFFGPGATVKVNDALPGIDFYVDCAGMSHFNGSENEQASITFNNAGSSVKDAGGNTPSTGSLSATSLTNVTGPSPWPANGTGCGTTANAKLGTSEVTIVTPDTSGTYTYTIAYIATRGANTASNELDPNVTNLPGGDPNATPYVPDKATFTLTVDADDPTIDLRTPPDVDADAVYNVNEAVTVDYDCADPGATDTPPTGSGIKTTGGCVGSDSHNPSVNVADGAMLDTSTPGNYTFTVNAEDNVGNKASVTHNYTVVAPCSFSEIRPPVNDVSSATEDGMSSYKYGSKGVIPAKFQATCDGSLVDTQAEADANPMTLKLTRLGSLTGGVDTELETTSAGSANTGNLFRFDDAADQYIYNLNIKGLSAGVYSITISDGSGSHTEWFAIK